MLNNKIHLQVFSLITILPVLVYLNSLENTFVYDDYLTITNNHFIRDWRYLSAFFNQKYFVVSNELTYRPIVTLSYFMDYALWQLRPFGYHLTNIAIHTINGIMVYFLAYLLFHTRTTAFISCLLFTIHPIFTEAVNAVSYREDLLSATFLLAAFILFLKSNQRVNRKRFIIYYTLSVLMYLFALLSKEMAITFPLLIIACDFIFPGNHNTVECRVPTDTKGSGLNLKQFTSRFVTKYVGYIVISVFYLFLRFYLFRNAGESAQYPGNSVYVNGIMMIKVLGYYCKLLFIPAVLNADYVVPLTCSPDAAFILSSLVLIVVIIISVKQCSKSSVWGFALFWFIITLLPVLNIIPINNIMAERYLYIPVIGFTMLIGSLVNQRISKYKVFRGFFIGPIAVVCLLAIWGTVGRNRVWVNEFTFSTETIRRSPKSFRVYNDLGYFYYHNGLTDAAIQAFKDSIQVRYDQPKAHCNLGAAYSLKGLDDAAIEELRVAITLRNQYPEAHNNLGILYKRKGMLDNAVNEYIEALKVNPYHADAHNNLGSALIDQGRLDEALSELERAVKIRKNFPLAQYNIAVVYYKKGQMKEAYDKLLEAYQLDPTNADVHISLGVLYLDYFHDKEKALTHIKEALRLNPNHKQAEQMKSIIGKLVSVGKPP